jgi:hypothetical protein
MDHAKPTSRGTVANVDSNERVPTGGSGAVSDGRFRHSGSGGLDWHPRRSSMTRFPMMRSSVTDAVPLCPC